MILGDSVTGWRREVAAKGTDNRRAAERQYARALDGLGPEDATWTMEWLSPEIERISGYPASDFIQSSTQTPENSRPPGVLTVGSASAGFRNSTGVRSVGSRLTRPQCG